MSPTTTKVGLIAPLVSRLPQVRLLGLVRCRSGESLLGRCWAAYTTSTSGVLRDPSRYGCIVGTPQGTSQPTPAPPHAHGDLDCDGVIDSVDALLLLRQIVYQSTSSASACSAADSIVQGEIIGDVDCNGVLEPTDGLAILQFVVGLPVVHYELCLTSDSTSA